MEVSKYYCEWCHNFEVQFNLEILLCDLLQEAVGIRLSYLQLLIFSSKETVLPLKAHMVKNKVPALMPSCKYALTHKPMVANICCFICHDCQELVKRKFYFSQFILVAYRLRSSMASWSSEQTSRFQTWENNHRYTWNAYKYICKWTFYLIDTFSYDLKDSERDIRMLKTIQGVAVKCWKFGSNQQISWTGGNRMLNVPKIYEGLTTH